MDIIRPRGVLEYLGILWRGKPLIMLVAVFVSIATTLVVHHIPNIYESHALISVTSQGGGNETSPTIPSLTTLTQRMTSQANMAEIVNRYNLYQQVPGVGFDTNLAVERLRRNIKLDIKMRNYYPDAPEALLVSFRYTDPDIAQKVLSDLISIFEQTNNSTKQQIEKDLKLFRSQIAEIEEQLQRLAPQRDLALSKSGSGGGEKDPSAIRAQRLAATDSISSLDDKEFMLKKQIDDTKKQIEDQEKLVHSISPTSPLAGNNAYGVLLGRRAEVEGQIRDLSRTYTDKNPKMIQARAQLEAINQEIAKLESQGANSGAVLNAGSPEAHELRDMRRDLMRMENELEVTHRDLGRKMHGLKELPNVQASASSNPAGNASGVELNEAKAEYDRLLGRYNYLMDKQDSLNKLSGEIGRNGEMFQVIDTPISQSTPVGPNRWLLRFFGLGFALALGLIAAAVRETPRLFKIHDERDVEYYLGIRVLSMIPETLTPFQRGRRRVLYGIRWLGIAMLLGAMVPVFIIVLDHSQIFQMLANR